MSITKTGTGYWRLTGSNDYIGTTTVTGGNLIVNGTNSGTGAYNVIGSTAVLSGKGTIAGAVRIYENGTIQAGDMEEGANGSKLTLKSTLEVKAGGIVNVLMDGMATNTIAATGTVTLADGAILQFGETDAPQVFAEGEVFKVFSSAVTVAGSVKIMPETPGAGLKWDTTSLATSGEVKVVADDTSAIGGVAQTDQASKVEYFDLDGKQTKSPKGTYIVRVTDKSGRTTTRKVMK